MTKENTLESNAPSTTQSQKVKVLWWSVQDIW